MFEKLGYSVLDHLNWQECRAACPFAIN